MGMFSLACELARWTTRADGGRLTTQGLSDHRGASYLGGEPEESRRDALAHPLITQAMYRKR